MLFFVQVSETILLPSRVYLCLTPPTVLLVRIPSAVKMQLVLFYLPEVKIDLGEIEKDKLHL